MLLSVSASTDLIDSSVSDPSQSHASRPSASFRYLLLILITVFGGVLRFTFLDRPGIWGDEGLTFGRVYGTFGTLLQRLSDAGFAPLHYELLWLIGQHFKLTPIVMRFVPAVAGTLMIPAMYWLTRELLGRRERHRHIALLVALLTACNAFLLNYSRDAKMYSPFWLFAALNVASLLWWLHSRRGPAFWAWVSSGAAMIGFDALGAITLAIELLIVLTASRPRWPSIPKASIALLCGIVIWLVTIGPIVLIVLWSEGVFPPSWRPWVIASVVVGVGNLLRLAILLFLRPERSTPTERSLIRPMIGWLNDRFAFPPLLLFLLGVVMIAAGPIGYYIEFNKFITRVDDRGWTATGIEWVGRYNRGRTAPELIASTASSYLTAWEWPRDTDVTRISIRTYRLLSSAVIAIAVLLALGLLPWRRTWNRSGRASSALHENFRHTTGEFRAAFWMTAWIVLPAYGFYCVSFPYPNYVSPTQWLRSGAMFLESHRWVVILIALFIGVWIWMSAGRWRARLVNGTRAVAVAVAVFGLAHLIHHEYPALDEMLAKNSAGWRTHDSVWMARYLAVVLPPVLIIVASLLWRLPTKTLRTAAIAFVVVVNLSQHAARLFAGSEPPTESLAQDFVDSHAGHTTIESGGKEKTVTTRTYYTLAVQNSSGFDPGTAAVSTPVFRYYITQASNEPPDPIPWHRPLNGYRPLPSTWAGVDFARFIADDVHRSPSLERFVTWQKLQPGELDLTDRPLDLLEPEWRLVNQEDFTARDHWRWIDLSIYRRRVYVRDSSDNSPVPPATTQHH